MFELNRGTMDMLKKISDYKNKTMEECLIEIVENYYNLNFSNEKIFETLDCRKKGRRVICYFPDKTTQVFNSMVEAAEKTGAFQSTISMCCNGKLNKTHGMTFRYFD